MQGFPIFLIRGKIVSISLLFKPLLVPGGSPHPELFSALAAGFHGEGQGRLQRQDIAL
jgi:hypothetical protein